MLPASGVRPASRALRGAAREFSGAPLPFHHLFFIGLDRRTARRAAFERRCGEALRRAPRCGGSGFSRFPAAEGSRLDLEAYPEGLVTRRGLLQAASPPAVVNGVHLTRGALGLIMSYHALLRRIAADASGERVYIIAEDDAVFQRDFLPRLGDALGALQALDPAWDFLHIGYYDDDCTLRGLDTDDPSACCVICRPVQVFGLFGAAIRPHGARVLLERLFPLEEQIDSALSHVYGALNAYATRTSLMTAAHSTAADTDIQILRGA